MEYPAYYIGVDVGTGSVRAALVDDRGNVIKTEEISINIYNPKMSFYEQSSNEIWSACCKAIKVQTGIIGIYFTYAPQTIYLETEEPGKSMQVLNKK